MKADDLIDAFGNIDPKYISDAEVEIKSKSQMKRIFYVIREKFPLEKEQPAHITISAALCMTAFVLIIGAGMFYGRIRDGYSGNSSMEHSSMESASADRDDNMDGSTAAGSADEAGVETAEEDTGLIFNEIREMESIAYDMAEPDQIISYDAAGLEEYFGTVICPASIPEDLVLADEKAVYHVGYDKDQNVVDDNNELVYSDEREERTLKIGVRTTESGIVTRFTETDLATSLVHGVTVTVGCYPVGQAGGYSYTAIFEKDGIIFTVESSGLTEEEFTTVIGELTE